MLWRRGVYLADLVGRVDEVENTLTQWRETVMNPGSRAPSGGAAPGVVADLFKILTIGVEEEEGAGKPHAPRGPLFVLPDGILNEIPLETLPNPRDPSTELGAHWSIVQCLRFDENAVDESPIDFSRGWLGIAGGGPPAFGMPELPGAEKEVRGVERLLREEGRRARVIHETEASVPGFLMAVETMDPGVLHLAVHGVASEKHPEAGFLVLPNPSGPREDAILSFRRLARLDLSRVQLVVLSACSGAAGASGRSRGLEGLIWAILEAGASRVVAGRHDVGDRATFAMMIQFYKHLLKGRSPGEAMRSIRARPRLSQDALSTMEGADGIGSRGFTICKEDPAREYRRQLAAWGVWA